MGILRILLALAVLASHVGSFGGLRMISGAESVKIFFVISGFYMALILYRKYNDYFLFYSNRFIRLYPVYALILIASMGWYIFDWLYTHQRPPPFWTTEAAAQMPLWQWLSLSLSSLTMVGLDIPPLFHWKSGLGFLFLHFGAARAAPDGAGWVGDFTWIGPAWSVGSEIWFYLLAPFLVKRHLAILLTVAGGSLCLMLVMELHGLRSYFFFPANLWLFISGVILFRAYDSGYAGGGLIWGYAVMIYVAVTACTVGFIDSPFIHLVILTSIAVSIPFLFRTFSSFKWDGAVGNLSYPLYLSHVLISAVLLQVFHIKASIVIALVCIATSALLVRYVDNPLDRYRQRRLRAVASRGSASAIDESTAANVMHR